MSSGPLESPNVSRNYPFLHLQESVANKRKRNGKSSVKIITGAVKSWC